MALEPVGSGNIKAIIPEGKEGGKSARAKLRSHQRGDIAADLGKLDHWASEILVFVEHVSKTKEAAKIVTYK